MQVQIEQVHWSGLKGSEMSIGAIGELSEVSDRREEGGGMCGAATALRFIGAVSDSWKIGETGLGAVVDGARGLPSVAEYAEREVLYSGLTGEMMLDGGTEETTVDLDWLASERGDFEGAFRGLTGDIRDSGGKAPDAIGPGEFLLARELSSIAHFICSSSVGARRCSVLGSYRP